MTIRLVKPTLEHKERAIAAVMEYRELNEDMEATSGLEFFIDEEGYEAWVAKLETDVSEPDPDYVPHETLFLMEADRIVGIVNIRWALTPGLLETGGHVGYGIQPRDRNRGLGTMALKLALERCDEIGISRVLVACNETNVPSRRVIEKCGGVYEDSKSFRGSNYRRYWFDRGQPEAY